MQAAVRAWVLRAAAGSARGLRGMPPPMLLSLLCASAFSPLIPAVAGLGAAAVAGSTVLSSISGGALSGIIASALDRARSKSGPRESALAGAQEQIAGEISRVLAAGDASARELRTEIAAVLQEIDAGSVMVRAAMEEGDERVRRDVIAAIEVLGSDFAEMRFLITDVALAAAQIQESLDLQGADIRAVIEQNQRQSADIRLVRDDVAAMARRAGAGGLDAGGNGAGLRWPDGCPYLGLLPFEEADAEVFYGRERLTAELAVKVAAQVSRGGLVVVTGASGAGKSSLLRAGLLPKLAQGRQVAGSGDWLRIVMTPTRDPLTELAARLAAFSGGHTTAIREELASHPGRAHLPVRSAVLADGIRRSSGQPASGAGAARLVLIIDQFEQVFTLAPGPGGETERKAFITALRAAATHPAGPAQEPAALVVIAVRGDFWDRCAAYPELAGALQDGQFVVGPMTESELRTAITGPADAAGLSIEPGLTGNILDDLRVAGGDGGAGALPLLSQAMALTWENREGDRLTSRGYGQSGGVSRAVQVSADSVYDSLPPGQQELARGLLRQMTVAGRDGRVTRRPVTRADLYAGHPDADRAQVDAVLEAFAARRLVVLDADMAQISHDVLLSAWPGLRGWLEEDQASWILYSQLADDAAAWHDHHDDPSFLYRGTQLTALQQANVRWSAGLDRYPALTGTQYDFLRASQRAAARGARQRRNVVASLAVLVVAALIATAFAFQQRSSALQQSTSALSQRDQAIYNEITAEAFQASATNPSLAAQLTLAAYRMKPTQKLATQLLGTEDTPLSTPLATNSNSPIESVAVSPDGLTLASGNQNGVIQLWDIGQSAHPRPLSRLVTGGAYISSLAFSPDGRTLVAAGSPSGAGVGAIWLWDVSSPAHPRPLGQPLSPNGRTVIQNDFSAVNAVAFTPDGRVLATGGSVYSGNSSSNLTIQLWDMSNPAHPRLLGQCTPSGNFIQSLTFNPDGNTLAASSQSIGPGTSTVQLWNVRDAVHPRRLGPRLAGDHYSADPVAFSRAGILATGGNSGAIQLWDAADPAHLRPLGTSIENSSDSPCSLVMFSPDGQTLACFGSSDTIQLWSVVDPAQPRLLSQALNGGSNDGFSSLAFSSGGRILATGDGNGVVQLWNIPQTVLAGSGTGGIGSLAFSPDGRILASVDYDGSAQLWDVANPAASAPLGSLPVAMNRQITSLTFSPDSRILAGLLMSGQTGTVQLWNIANPAHPESLGHPLTGAGFGGIGSITFSPDGRTLAVVNGDGAIQLWNIDNPSHPEPGPQIISGNNSTIASMTFNPDGNILATVDYSGDLQLWNAVHPPSVQIALGSATAPSNGPILPTLAYSPSGRILTLLPGNGTVELWNVVNPADPNELGQLPTATTGLVDAIAFSQQGILASVDGDGAIQLWTAADPAHPRPFGQPIAGSSAIISVAFSPDGTMASGTSTGTIVLWDLHVSDAIKRICTTAGGNLTPQNWHNYISQLPYQSPCGP